MNTATHPLESRACRFRAASLAPVCLILVLAGCGKPPVPPVPPPPLVQVLEVAKTDVERTTTFVGQIDSPQNVQVRARVESFLETIEFKEGSEVKEGDLLFRLDTKPYEEKLVAAKARLAEAQAEVSKHKLDVARLTPLAAQGAVPQRDLDTAKTALEIGEANVLSAQAQIKSAELDLGYCEIHAPLSGRIGAKDVSIGSLVGKGEPTLLTTISQIDPVWFYCYIGEVDFLRAERAVLEAGGRLGELPVTLILADGSEHSEKGKWIFVDRMVDASTATIRARAEFPDPDKLLRPGMFARARINLPALEGKILVPERALTEVQGRQFVWVIDADNKASQRPVEVAPVRSGADAIVLSGLEPGERVVVEGMQKLREGAPAQPRTAEELAAATAAATGAAKPGGVGHAGEAKPATDKE
jgi:membrane fusion protein (multidrug efflux system)